MTKYVFLMTLIYIAEVLHETLPSFFPSLYLSTPAMCKSFLRHSQKKLILMTHPGLELLPELCYPLPIIPLCLFSLQNSTTAIIQLQRAWCPSALCMGLPSPQWKV